MPAFARMVYYGIDQSWREIFSLTGKYSGLVLNSGFRRAIFASLFLLMTYNASAPDSNHIVVVRPQPINPFSALIYATGMVETKGNIWAFNEHEKAAGIFQIRQVRIDDYNKRTGNKYTLTDMFDYEISEKIFLYFASLVGPYDFERIAKRWNGSGPMTEMYWKRIKAYLD